MKRGAILMNDNNYYMLVRIESGVTGTNANGKKCDMQFDRYNLVNLDTGKTRVSEPERMYLIPSMQENILVDSLRSHFKMPNLQDTGLAAGDVNFGSVVAQAVHDKRMRAAISPAVAPGDPDATLNACIAALRQLGFAG